jgi:transposase
MALTTPEHLKKWFTPAPWTTVDCEIDLRPGGIFRTMMRLPEGQEITNVGCYLEVIKNEKLIWTPAVLLGLLIYGYATGVPSSRKIERASYDSVVFRYIAANTHPDHDTLANFRRRFGPQLEQLFVQVLMLAREMGMLKLGKISVDGSKIKANANLVASAWNLKRMNALKMT